MQKFGWRPKSEKRELPKTWARKLVSVELHSPCSRQFFPSQVHTVKNFLLGGFFNYYIGALKYHRRGMKIMKNIYIKFLDFFMKLAA